MGFSALPQPGLPCLARGFATHTAFPTVSEKFELFSCYIYKVGADKFVPTDPQSDRETQSGRPPEESLTKSTLATQLTHTGERPGRISQSVLVRTSLAHMPMCDTPRFMLQEACFLGVCSNMRVLEGTRSMCARRERIGGRGRLDRPRQPPRSCRSRRRGPRRDGSPHAATGMCMRSVERRSTESLSQKRPCPRDGAPTHDIHGTVRPNIRHA